MVHRYSGFSKLIAYKLGLKEWMLWLMSNFALYPLFFFQKRSKKRGKRKVESEEVYDEPDPVSEDTAVCCSII